MDFLSIMYKNVVQLQTEALVVEEDGAGVIVVVVVKHAGHVELLHRLHVVEFGQVHHGKGAVKPVLSRRFRRKPE